MLNSILPQHTPDLVHSPFGSIVDLLASFLFLIKLFEVVVFGHYDLGGQVGLASAV